MPYAKQLIKHTSDLLTHTNIEHGFFGRHGGISKGYYASLNCGPGSQDDTARVMHNRRLCTNALLACDPEIPPVTTLHQIHSATAVYIDQPMTETTIKADALVTDQKNITIGILTADCMPVLFYTPGADIIGAAHAGWRGALEGILENCVGLMLEKGARPSDIRASFGPCLRQENFEVGMDLVETFKKKYPNINRFLKPVKIDEKKQLDLVGFGAWRLQEAGIKDIHIDKGNICTLDRPEDFFSYRHSNVKKATDYGRNLSAIVLKPNS